MRLSLVFELLLICLLIGFSAYARVINKSDVSLLRTIKAVNSTNKQGFIPTITLPSLKQAEETMNKHCYCNENVCNCCRDFHIPLVRLTGPGCASLQYLQGDNLQVQLSFGNNILTTGVISGKNPKPICVTLPGGYSKFCGKVYSIKKEADRHFKACLGLELQSSNELEASLRVSCFRFGPEGLKLRPAEEFPVVITPAPADDDDDDDIFGLGDDDDDDDEDEEEDDGVSPEGNVASNPSDDDEDEEDDEDDDVLGFEALLDIFTGDDDTTKKPKVTTPLPIIQPFTIPFLTSPSTSAPEPNNLQQAESVVVSHSISSTKPEEPITEKLVTEAATVMANEESSATETINVAGVTEAILSVENEPKKPESSEQETVEPETVEPEKPEKPVTVPTVKHKKVQSPSKPSVTSTSANAIVSDVKKPVVRPSTPDPAINDVVPQEEQEEDEDDDEDDILGTEDLDEEDDDDEDEKDETEEEEDEDEEDHENSDSDDSEDVKDEDLEEELDDDDDDDEDEEVLTTLVEGDKETKTKVKKVANKNKLPNKINEAGNLEEDDADYGYSLSELLARKVPRVYRGRESKVMRL